MILSVSLYHKIEFSIVCTIVDVNFASEILAIKQVYNKALSYIFFIAIWNFVFSETSKIFFQLIFLRSNTLLFISLFFNSFFFLFLQCAINTVFVFKCKKFKIVLFNKLYMRISYEFLCLFTVLWLITRTLSFWAVIFFTGCSKIARIKHRNILQNYSSKLASDV